MDWIVSQVGARQHYATPIAFQRRGELRRFYTEAWSGRARGLLHRFPGAVRAFAQRYSPELPSDKVAACNTATLFSQLVSDRINPPENGFEKWSREGEHFAKWVNRQVAREPLNPKTTAFYGCKSVCLETLQAFQKQGVFTLADQADPSKVEEDLVQQERARWPGWEPASDVMPAAYYNRCKAEWMTADVVMVYSEWTRQAIIEQGVPAEKVIAVPLAYEAKSVPVTRPTRNRDRMTVLWLGTVVLRKGIPYLIEAARQLQDRPIDFVVAGQVNISKGAIASAPPNMRFIGRIIRGQTAQIYESADLFVLPTISDSFGLTQVEAMSHGLPVIATPRCGTVVTDGVDGRLVPAGDATALAAAISGIEADRSLLAAMSAAAPKKAATFTLDSYAQQIHDEVITRRPELAGGSSTRG